MGTAVIASVEHPSPRCRVGLQSERVLPAYIIETLFPPCMRSDPGGVLFVPASSGWRAATSPDVGGRAYVAAQRACRTVGAWTSTSRLRSSSAARQTSCRPTRPTRRTLRTGTSTSTRSSGRRRLRCSRLAGRVRRSVSRPHAALHVRVRRTRPRRRLVMRTQQGPFPMETTYTWAAASRTVDADDAAQPR